MRIFVKGGFLLVALCFCFGYLYHTSHAVNQENQGKEESPTVSDEQLARAKVIFKEKCARCHGVDGRGQTVLGGMLGVPNFTDRKWWKHDIKVERLIESLRNGKRNMPKFGKKLTRQEIAWLVAFLCSEQNTYLTGQSIVVDGGFVCK